MAETIDELKIEVEAEATNATTTIKDLSNELKSLKTSLEGVDTTKLKNLGSTFEKLGNINLSNSSKELRSLDKELDSVTQSVSKDLSNNLINQFNITDQRVKKSVESMSKKFVDLNKSAIFDQSKDSLDKLGDAYAKLEDKVSQNANGLVDDQLKDFYEYWKAAKPVYVSDKVKNDFNTDNWNGLLKEFPGKFTTDLMKMQNSVNSVYSELEDYYQGLFPDDIINESEQFQKIVDVLREYKRELADTTSVAQGFKSVQDAVNNTISSAMNDLSKGYGDVLGTGIDAREQQNAYNQVATQPGSGFSQSTELISELSAALKKLPNNDTLESIVNQINSLNNVGDISATMEGLSKLVDLLNQLPADKISTIGEISNALKALCGADFEGLEKIPSAEALQDLSEGLTSLTAVDAEKLEEVASAINKISASVSNLGTNGSSIEMPTLNGGISSEDASNIENVKTAEDELANSVHRVSEAQKEASSNTQKAGDEEATAAKKVTIAQKDAAEQTKKTGDSMAASSKKSASAQRSTNNEFQKIGSILSKSGNVATSSFAGITSAITKLLSVSKGMGQLSSSLAKVGTAAGKLEGKALSAGKNLAEISLQRTPLGKLTGIFDKVSNACSGLNGKLSRTVHLFTMMAMRSAFRAVMDELGESFEHLAQKSEEVNQRYSSLISSMNQLAHSIAALAQPLLNIFGPALEYIINLLNDAINYVNQFLSALTGKQYYTTGKKVATDYAASLQDEADAASDAADAQKELNKQLQGFNELNNMTTNLNNGSGTNNVGSNAPESLEDCYEELAINQKILDVVEKLKELLGTLFDPMKAAWDKYGQGVIDSLEYALSSVWQLIKDMGQTWIDVWTNGSGEELCSNILLLLTSMFNWIGDIATAWDDAWNTKGEAYVQSIFDLLNAVLETVIDISETFREAFNNGEGEEIIENIYQILTNSNNIIKDMVLSFKDAWDEEGRGIAIAETFFAAINDILLAIEAIQEAWSDVWNNGSGTEICGQILDLVLLIEQGVQSIAVAFTNAWENCGRGVALIQSIFDAFSSILSVITTIGNSLLTVWSNGSGEKIIGGILQIFTDINNTITIIADSIVRAWNNADTGTSIIQHISDIIVLIEDTIDAIAVAFTNAWNKGEAGDGLVQSILDKFSSILQTISDIGNSLLTVWSNGSGERIIGNILQIFTDINNAVTGLATNFDNAWKHADTGTSIVQGIADIAGTLLEHVQGTYASFKDWCEKLDFSPLLEAFDKLVQAVDPLADNVGQGLEWFYENVCLPIGQWAIETAFPVVLDNIRGGIELLNSVIGAAKDNLGWLWTDFLKPVGTWTGNLLTDAFEWFAECLSGLAEVFNGNMSVWEWITEAFGSAYEHTTSYKASLESEDNMGDTADEVIDSSIEGRIIRSNALVKMSEDSASDKVVEEVADSSINGRAFKAKASVELAEDPASDDVAVKAVDSDNKSLKTKIVTTVEKAAGGVAEAWSAIKLASEEGDKKAQASVEANLSKGGSDEAWTILEDGVYKNENMNIETSVKLAKSGWESVTGWFKDKFGSLFGGSSDDESITVKIKLDKKNSDKVSDILDSEQSVKVVLSDKSEKLTKVLDDEFTTKVKLSSKSEKLDSILDKEFTTTVKLSSKSEKLDSILDNEFTTKVKLKKDGWDSFTEWLGGTDIDANVKLTPAASSLWSTLKSDWTKAAGTVEFSADIKDESGTWWKNTQNYWKKKVGTADNFKTDVENESDTWWKNAKSYWKKKVGSAENFSTDVENESDTWWKNAKKYWKDKVGSVENFKTDVENEGSTWWSNTKKYWEKVVGYVKEFQVNVKDDSKTWWEDVKTYWENTSASKYLTVMVRGKVETSENWWTDVANKLKSKIGTIYSDVRGTRDTSSDWWTNLNSVLKSWIGKIYVDVRGTRDTSSDWWSNLNDVLKSWIGRIYVDVRGTRDTSSNWWKNLNSVLKSWIGKVYVDVRGQVDYSTTWYKSVNTSLKNAIGTVTVGVQARSTGGVYQNGSWSNIPQYAGGTVNAGSLFVAGEAGAELVGHIGSRTEVLNESQLAAVMEDSVIAGVSSLAEYLNGIYKHMTVCTNAVIGAIAVNYDTPQVMPNISGYCMNDYGNYKDQYGRDMETVIDLLGQIADNTDYEETPDVNTDQLFRMIRQKSSEYHNATGKSAFA